MPINQNSGVRREGTIEEKVQVIAMRAQGDSWSKIERESAFRPTQAKHVVKVWEEEDTLDNTPRYGGPQKLSKEEVGGYH